MRQRIEETLQRQIVAFCKAAVPHSIIFAIPNAARRSPYGRATNGVPGLLRGAPDLVLLLDGGGVVWIEVKAPKGRVSDDQRAVHGILRSLGHEVEVVRSLDDVVRTLALRGVEIRGELQ